MIEPPPCSLASPPPIYPHTPSSPLPCLLPPSHNLHPCDNFCVDPLVKMMAHKDDDLALSLTLGSSSSNATASARDDTRAGADRTLQLRQPPPSQLNLISSLFSSNSSSSSTSSPPLAGLPFAYAAPQKTHFNDCFASADRAIREPKSFLKGIDVNRRPTNAAEEEEAGVSSPNSTISSLSGKRSEREATVGAGDEPDAERACSRGISDEEDGETSRKKLRLSKDQSALLEESFKEHSTLNPKQKMALAQRLGLRPRQVEVWFQNRRARTKLKQTEVDCEFLKRCCEQLTEENRRLQKEVQELRALKLSPQMYMQMAPPTTLTICPSCERVAAPPSASAAVVHRPLPTNPWGVPAGHMEALRP